MSRSLSPVPVNVTSFGNRVFANAVKVRILSETILNIRGALNAMAGVPTRGKGEREAEKGVGCPWDRHREEAT